MSLNSFIISIVRESIVAAVIFQNKLFSTHKILFDAKLIPTTTENCLKDWFLIDIIPKKILQNDPQEFRRWVSDYTSPPNSVFAFNSNISMPKVNISYYELKKKTNYQNVHFRAWPPI